MANRRFGLAHFSAIDLPPTKLVAFASEAGFAWVGLRLHEAFAGSPYYPLRSGTRAIRDLRAQLLSEGMAVHDVEFVSITSDFAPASVEATLEAGAELGAKRLSVAGDDPVRPRFLDNFAKLCELASTFDIGVDLENMGWRSIATFADSLAVLNEVKPSAAGALVDALHFYRNGGELSELAECPQQFIRSVQVCDVGGPAPATRDAMIAEARSGRAAPGEGDLNLSGLLNAAPIEAAVSVEVPISQGVPPSSHLNHLFETTKALLDGMLPDQSETPGGP